MTALVWLRSDLRLDDNAALAMACRQHEQVVALFAITPQQWHAHDMAPVRVEFLLRRLHDLQAQLQGLRIPLRLIQVDDFAALPEALASLCRELSVRAVYASREYPVNELARDRACGERLAEQGVHCHWLEDFLLLPPGSVRKSDGTPYQVFTPFKRAWLARAGQGPLELEPIPTPRAQAPCASDPIPSVLPGWPASPIDPARWPATEAAALARLRRFAEERMARYRDQRDLPALDATSTLSPYLACGVLSIRRCLAEALWHNQGQWQGGSPGIDCWINELIWREFYTHVLVAWPQVCRYRAFQADTEQLPWRHADEPFQRWCEGRTGFALVDAGMRQLQQEGWMHNRVRMVTAQFLTKYLLIDWRWGERHFMRHLIDGELAANNGGWQWCASTGTDAAPYFRVLSPVLQQQRFDPEGHYVQRYLPELAGLPGKVLAEPGHRLLHLRGYPEPMVDLKQAKARTLAAFRGLKEAP